MSTTSDAVIKCRIPSDVGKDVVTRMALDGAKSRTKTINSRIHRAQRPLNVL